MALSAKHVSSSALSLGRSGNREYYLRDAADCGIYGTDCGIDVTDCGIDSSDGVRGRWLAAEAGGVVVDRQTSCVSLGKCDKGRLPHHHSLLEFI